MAVVPHTFSARLWQYGGETATWHFLTLPKSLGAILKDRQLVRRGFGTRRVRATIGATTWETSLFPDRQSGSYFLPVKAAVRRAEEVDVGDEITCSITMLS